MKYYTTYFMSSDEIAAWLNRWGFLINENFVHILPNDSPDGGYNVIYKARRQIGAYEIPTEQQKREALWT